MEPVLRMWSRDFSPGDPRTRREAAHLVVRRLTIRDLIGLLAALWHRDEDLLVVPPHQQERRAARADALKRADRFRRARDRLAVHLQDDVAGTYTRPRRAATRIDIRDERARRAARHTHAARAFG